MKDSIIFLGTGGDPIVVGKQIRGAGGFIIEAEGNQFHVDPGPGSLVAMNQYGINVREHTSIFVTHKHLNHAHDVNAVIGAMTYNGMDKHGILVAPEDVKESGVVSEFYANCMEKFISFNEDSKIAINEIEIEGIPAKHGDTEAVGYRFTAPNFTLCYTGDTEYVKRIGEACKDSDILVVNCKNPLGVSEKGQMNLEDVVELVNEAEPRLVVITHFGIKSMKQDPLSMAREIQKRTKVQTLAATDGMTLDPDTFASKVRQKKLKNFK